jgi:hypothetical protein
MNSESSDNHSKQEEEITIKELILKVQDQYSFLLSKWTIIVVIGLLGGAIGLGYSLIKKPIYTATTTFVLEEEKSGGGLGSLAGLASVAGVNFGGGGNIFQGDNILELYKSRTMITSTLLSSSIFNGKRQQLIDRFIETKDLREKWDDKPNLKNISFADSSKFTIQHDSLINEIVKYINKEALNVNKIDKKLSIIKVQFSFEDELFSKAFTDQIVATVNNFYIRTKIKKAKVNVEILQRQTDSVRAVLNGAIFSAATTIDATPNLNPTRQVLRAPVQRSQLTAETNKAMLSELIKNLELAKMAERKETPLIQIIDNPILPLDKAKLGKLKAIVLGGLLAGLLTVIWLLSRRMFKNIMNNE